MPSLRSHVASEKTRTVVALPIMTAFSMRPSISVVAVASVRHADSPGDLPSIRTGIFATGDLSFIENVAVTTIGFP